MEHCHPLHGGGDQMGISSWLVFTLLTTSCFFTHLSSAVFNPATSFLLNCGSDDDATAQNDLRTFIPDSTSGSVAPSSSTARVADRNPSPGTSPLYRTARVFTGRSSYEFTVRTDGAHVLRLHFFPFLGDYDLFSAVFDVTALKRFRLLSKFSVTRGADLPVIKEYLLWVDSGKLDVTFTQSDGGSASRVAFVSAIEVFTAPTELIWLNTERFAGLSRQVGLETVHRINMGGPLIVPSNDTLWRTWVPDDRYLFGKETAAEVSTTLPIQYRNDSEGSTREIAPDRVYSTARAMNTGVLQDPRFNITWQFNVSGGVSHLVRMHFYDMVSKSAADLYFNAYVDGEVVYKDLQPSIYTFNSYAVPFYWDSVVNDSGGGAAAAGVSRVMRVSVGRSAKSPLTAVNATLNGLEIMRILNGGDLGSAGGGGSKKKFLYILIPSVLGGLALLALLISCSLLLSASRRRCRSPPERKETTAESWSPLPGDGVLGKSVTTVVNLGLLITFDEIRFATNDFDEGLVIGSGGFGKVYRGVLRDGTRVAVKRGMPGSAQGYPEFQREVTVLSMIRHRHLVSLIGYCEERGQMILVYEFMEKGTLRSLLYGSGAADDAAPCLSWKRRLEICIGAARGIHYLHTSNPQGIIHRDLKSSNILLGEGYVAKVSDFGLSRLGPSLGETHVSTGVKGSFGYLDPEYFKTRQLTDKSDVYSFGVVLFEALCARPALDPQQSSEQINLGEWATLAQRKGRLEQIVDPTIRGTINPNSLRKFGETAVKCLANYGVDRPAIGDVLWSLEYCLQLQETELRKEPHEDSGAIPVPVALRRVPSSNVRIEEGGDGGAPGVDKGLTEFSTSSNVFSQLITHQGR